MSLFSVDFNLKIFYLSAMAELSIDEGSLQDDKTNSLRPFSLGSLITAKPPTQPLEPTNDGPYLLEALTELQNRDPNDRTRPLYLDQLPPRLRQRIENTEEES